jgi:hypothetical protein
VQRVVKYFKRAISWYRKYSQLLRCLNASMSPHRIGTFATTGRPPKNLRKVGLADDMLQEPSALLLWTLDLVLSNKGTIWQATKIPAQARLALCGGGHSLKHSDPIVLYSCS